MSESSFTESFKVAADQLVEGIRKILHEGNVRRVIIKQDGRTVVEFPMTVGVVGAVFAPILAAAGALAAVLTECTIEVERGSRFRPDGSVISGPAESPLAEPEK